VPEDNTVNSELILSNDAKEFIGADFERKVGGSFYKTVPLLRGTQTVNKQNMAETAI
jgi:hypothetical protein